MKQLKDLCQNSCTMVIAKISCCSKIFRKYQRISQIRAPNQHKKELRKELKRTEDEMREIERDIQNRIDKQFEEKEIQDVKVKYGEKQQNQLKISETSNLKFIRRKLEKSEERRRREEEKGAEKAPEEIIRRSIKSAPIQFLNLLVQKKFKRKFYHSTELPPPPPPLIQKPTGDWEELDESYKELMIKSYKIKFEDSVSSYHIMLTWKLLKSVLLRRN